MESVCVRFSTEEDLSGTTLCPNNFNYTAGANFAAIQREVLLAVAKMCHDKLQLRISRTLCVNMKYF